MSYFKYLVILISFFLHFHIKASDIISFDNLYLSKNDLEIFKASLKEGDKTKWKRSLNSSKKINNKVAKKIIEWRWLVARDGLTNIETLKKFYLENKNWPQQKKIKEKIEAKINISNDKVEMLWFQDNPPQSGIGKIKLAEMLIKNNFQNEGYWLLNEAWKEHTFSYSEEKYIMSKFKNKISKDSHNHRMEELIWRRSWGSSRRQLKRVDNDIKLFSTAKINLARRRGNVDNAIKKVPKKYLSSESLIYERVKWRRRAKLEKSSFELLLSYQGKITKPDRWWREVNYHSRKQMSYKNYKSSINLLKNYNDNTNIFSYKSSWLAGWLSLTFENDPKTAYESFTNMFENVKSPI